MRANDAAPAPRSPSPHVRTPPANTPREAYEAASVKEEGGIYILKLEKNFLCFLNFSVWSPAGRSESGHSPCLRSSQTGLAILLRGRPPSFFPSPLAPTLKQRGLQSVHLPGRISQLQSWRGSTESRKDHSDHQCAQRLS